MTQKIDREVFIDAALRLLEQYASSSITYAEIIRESGCSRRCFYDNIDLDKLWPQVVEKLYHTNAMGYVYKREKRCARKLSQKIIAKRTQFRTITVS